MATVSSFVKHRMSSLAFAVAVFLLLFLLSTTVWQIDDIIIMAEGAEVADSVGVVATEVEGGDVVRLEESYELPSPDGNDGNRVEEGTTEEEFSGLEEVVDAAGNALSEDVEDILSETTAESEEEEEWLSSADESGGGSSDYSSGSEESSWDDENSYSSYEDSEDEGEETSEGDNNGSGSYGSSEDEGVVAGAAIVESEPSFVPPVQE
eukprot:GHVS01060441.1.p1 GENE.GHVS01060441.1~~GHVS01060441.1.p1  ORF type:complete len:208 (-),score=92.85 GHVS01060441.1:475-1098(-)